MASYYDLSLIDWYLVIDYNHDGIVDEESRSLLSLGVRELTLQRKVTFSAGPYLEQIDTRRS